MHRRVPTPAASQSRTNCPTCPSLHTAGALGTSVGFVLGLLGGGGSILALPMFLEVFHEPPSAAIAESLLVVAVGAGAGLLAKLVQGLGC